MKLNSDDLLSGIIDKLSHIDYVHSSDIPNIELYMDQVTTFMDSQLSATKRYEDDKILTKTMINNYTKNNLLPPSNKKKYSKEHVILLVFIYYFKSFLSIKDIETLLGPIKDNYFSSDGELDMTAIYEEICNSQKDYLDSMIDEIKHMFIRSEQSFADAPAEDKERLQLFSFLCSLCFDVYFKKMLIEQLLDDVINNKKD